MCIKTEKKRLDWTRLVFKVSVLYCIVYFTALDFRVTGYFTSNGVTRL